MIKSFIMEGKKMKKIAALGMGVLFMLTASGCGSDIDLSAKQEDQIAEYVAGTLLKHSYKEQWNYKKAKDQISGVTANTAGSMPSQSTQNIQNGQNTQSTQNQTDNGMSGNNQAEGQNGQTSQTESSDPLGKISTDLLGGSGAAVSYKAYVVDTRYPTDQYAVCVPADAGCKVLAVEFTISNPTGADITLNSADSGLTSKLRLKAGTVNQSKTILKNDISNLKDITVKAGGTYVAAAIYQVSDSAVGDLSGMNVTFYANSASLGSIDIQ